MNRMCASLLVMASLQAWESVVGAQTAEESVASAGETAAYLTAVVPGTTNRVALPLQSTEVYLQMTAGIVMAEVTQSFSNSLSCPLEAVYVFPLPAEATVIDMEMLVGDRVIKSVVQEKAKARETYEAAKAEGRKTSLLEQERPNIFTTSVANFQPGETIRISFAYVQSADYRKGSYSLTFPMVVGPRYIPAYGRSASQCAVPDADRITPPLLHPSVDSGHRLTLSAEIQGLPLSKITSSTHNIRIQVIDDAKRVYRVTLADQSVLPDCDFNLQIHLAERAEPEGTFLSSAGSDGKSYGLLTLFPPVGDARSAAEALPRDVLFLIDTSGSMDGTSITQARAGLAECLKMLRPADRFTIVRFANDYSAFSPQLCPADPIALRTAGNYVAALKAGGGTEMQKALEYTLRIPGDKDRVRLVIFLTDGDVGNEDELIRLVSRALGDARLFTFGIGSAPNEFLVRKIAEIGRGQFRFIRMEEDIGRVMADFFVTLSRPVLTHTAIAIVDRAGRERTDVVRYPDPCPDVFHDRPVQLCAEYPSDFSGTLLVSGMLNGKRVSYRYEIAANQALDFPAIDKLFGRSQINQSMVDRILATTPEQRSAIEREITDVALRHQLVSAFTSRVAVEEKVERQPDGTLVTVRQPTVLPRGWNPAQFNATATNDPALLLAGAIALLAGMGLLLRRLCVANLCRNREVQNAN